MTPIENLHYAIGELAYAIARADGEVQKEERQKFCDIVAEEIDSQNYHFDISSIIFQIMDKDNEPAELAYSRAIKQIHENSHYLSPQLKETFFKVMDKIAKAYPPVTHEESNLMKRFKEELESLNGDPVYYNSISSEKHLNIK